MTPEPATARNCFPEWAASELQRLIQARQVARTVDERTQCELQIAIICDAALRYGRTLAEFGEL
jgi:hypothetical protein